MFERTLLAIGAVVALMVAAPAAFAQSDSRADTDARAHFQRGRTAYDEGRFEDAVRAFRRAYVLSPRYQLLYNIGQAELQAGHDDRALQAFEAFLRQAPPDASERSEVQERATVLRGLGVVPSELGEATTQPTLEPSTPPPTSTVAPATTDPSPAQPASGGDATPWIVVGVGVAVLVGGAIMMGVAAAETQRVTDAPVGSRWVELQGTIDTTNVVWGVGIGAAALGLAAVGAGVVWGITSSGPGAEEEIAGASARLRMGLGSLSIEGEF
jgi:tetratricopeptide (TPR) repeat protein